MQSGHLSDKIVFEAKVFTTNAAGQDVVSWVAGFEAWSEVERNSETNGRFIIRYRSDVTPASHRIIWDGAIWDITSAVHDRKRTQLTIDCDFSMMQEATHLHSHEREFIEGLPLLRPRDT